MTEYLTIPGSPLASSVNTTDLVWIWQGGQLKSATVAQLSAGGVPVFTPSMAGIVPASGGGTTNFIRADGNWAAPPLTPPTPPAGSTGQLQINGGYGAFGAVPAINGDGSLNIETGMLTITGSNGLPFGSLAFANSVDGSALIGSSLASGITSSSLTSFGSGIVLGTPSSGALTNCTGLPIAGSVGYGTGVAAALAANVTGSGGIALATGPSLTTPALGAATGTSLALGSAGLLQADASNALALRNSTNAQTLRVYNTYASSTSYELAKIDWQGTSNLLRFGTSIGFGGGSARDLSLETGDTQYARITALGSFLVGATSALATNATDGFIYINSGAGTPTGTPTTQNSQVPLYFDTTNSQLWVYTGGAWKQPKTPAAAATVTWQ